jgi:hypothetical protein
VQYAVPQLGQLQQLQECAQVPDCDTVTYSRACAQRAYQIFLVLAHGLHIRRCHYGQLRWKHGIVCGWHWLQVELLMTMEEVAKGATKVRLAPAYAGHQHHQVQHQRRPQLLA